VITKVRLVEGDQQLVLLDRAAFRLDLILTSLEAPSPEVREVAESRTDDDGEDDVTTLHGARAVSATVELRDTADALVDELNGWMHPRRRPYLVVVNDEWAQERRLRLRSTQFSSPITSSQLRRRTEQLQWKAPDGVWEAVDDVLAVVNADGGQAAGRVYPEVYPRSYPATVSVGGSNVVNPGKAWSHQRVLLYGPAVGPRWSNDLTGETLTFTEELAIPAGEYLEIDTASRTANYMSDPSLSRLHLLDFEVSTWWRMAPGLNRVRYHPSAGTGVGSVAHAHYRPTWL
jgi:hypothetical protein